MFSYVSQRRDAQRTSRGIIQATVQAHPAIGVTTGCRDRFPKQAATQNAIQFSSGAAGKSWQEDFGGSRFDSCK